MAKHAREPRRPSPLALLAGGLLVGVLAGAGLVAAAAVPLASVSPMLAIAVPGVPDPVGHLHLPFPAQGEASVGVPNFGARFSTRDQVAVPIASLTKLMTAYVALTKFPLDATATGPSYSVTGNDVALYDDDLATDQSSVPVAYGETLTERQLLEGMLVHSANNYAAMLGELVAGSDDAMVVDMNDAARALGLDKTSYVDVSGFDPASVSTASNQLRLATILMENPTFASIVRMTSVSLPVAGVVTTFTPYLGQGGIVGIKTGYTSQAGGCDVMAYDDAVGRHKVLIVAVVLGQSSTFRPPLAAAGHAALVLASATAEHLHGVVVTIEHRAYGTLGWAGHTVRLVAVRTIDVPTFAGSPTRVVIVPGRWGHDGVARGEVVATVEVTSGAITDVSALVASGSLARPSLWQRLR